MSGDSKSPVSNTGTSQPAFPSPSMQNQIHELAKTLPPPRKQNTACDACRSRKVKCQRVPGKDKCQHCLSKNYPCTHFVQQATSERKRSTNMSRRPRNLSASIPSSSSPGPTKLSSPTAENIPSVFSVHPPTFASQFSPTSDISTREVLTYMFSPPENSNNMHFAHLVSPYTPWGELASKLEDENFRAEFALDLVEVFFQIVHSRIPLLNPVEFRHRLHLQPTSSPTNGYDDRPLHPALVATVIAWGTKFSEHPLLLADRRRPGGQSLLAKILVDRARDLAENMKVHRIPSFDHVIICLLLEPLQSQNPDDSSGFHSFWLRAGTRHLLDLQINHKSVASNITDPEVRGTMIFAWWMTCLCDAYGAVYYRRKPILDDDDYDLDFYSVDDNGPSSNHVQAMNGTPSPREQLEFLGYYTATHSLARTVRGMSRTLWKPVTESDGVPFKELVKFAKELTQWKEDYLKLVGVPSNFEGEWDFVSAVSSCASDATYHVMWIILFNALDDFGIKELNESKEHAVPEYSLIEQVKRQVSEEALQGALRIAGLVGVLTSNGYLRLDPAVMHVSCQHAGILLARLARPEVRNCIEGLEQYSLSYEEAGDVASDIKKTFDRGGEGFNHMADVAPRIILSNMNMNMMVDEPVRQTSSMSDTFLYVQ